MVVKDKYSFCLNDFIYIIFLYFVILVLKFVFRLGSNLGYDCVYVGVYYYVCDCCYYMVFKEYWKVFCMSIEV